MQSADIQMVIAFFVATTLALFTMVCNKKDKMQFIAPSMVGGGLRLVQLFVAEIWLGNWGLLITAAVYFIGGFVMLVSKNDSPFYYKVGFFMLFYSVIALISELILRWA